MISPLLCLFHRIQKYKLLLGCLNPIGEARVICTQNSKQHRLVMLRLSERGRDKKREKELHIVRGKKEGASQWR